MRFVQFLALAFCCRFVSAQSTAAGAATGSTEWEVTGTIGNRTGPLKGLYVGASGPEYKRAKTDSGGRYTLRGRQPGVYSILVLNSGDMSLPRSRTLSLTAGQVVSHFDFLVRDGATVTGKVTDRAGQPIAGMFVIAYERTRQNGRVRLVRRGLVPTDDRGVYRIAHLSPGAYVVGVETSVQKLLKFQKLPDKPGTSITPVYPPLTFSPGGRSLEAAAVFTLQDGEERSGVDVVLQKEPAYCVSVRAVTSGLNAGQGEKVELSAGVLEWMDARRSSVASSSIQIGEESQACGLSAGTYQLGLFAMVKSPFRGLGRTTRTFVINREHANLGDVVVAGLHDVNGKMHVKDATPGSPIPEGIRILLVLDRPLFPGDKLDGPIQQDGTFQISSVYPGEYGVKVRNLPAGYYVLKADQNGRNLRNVDLSTDAGPVAIELASDGPTLSGRVLTNDREPVPVSDATVFLISKSGGDSHIAQTDQYGVYSFTSGVEKGEYKVVAAADLMESQRRDALEGERFVSEATDVTLLAREKKSLDLRVIQGR